MLDMRSARRYLVENVELFRHIDPRPQLPLVLPFNLAGARIHVRQAARARPLRVGRGAVRRPQRRLLPSAPHHAQEGRQRQDGGHRARLMQLRVSHILLSRSRV